MKRNLNEALKEVKRQMKALHKSKPPEKKQKESKQATIEIKTETFKGTGKVMVSGTTVHGLETKFKTELKQGDSIILKHPDSEEKRKVSLVISDKSVLISESFNKEGISEYFVESFEEIVKEEEEEEIVKKQIVEDSEKVYEIRVKRGPWTYKIDKVTKKGDITNEDLLNVRAIRVRDKFCWM